jgi:hypothetical protein
LLVTLRFSSDPVHSGKSQHLVFLYPDFDLNCPVLRNIPAEDPSYVEKRAAPADQTDVMGAVTDNVAFSTQHGILQRNRIENPRINLRSFAQLAALYESPKQLAPREFATVDLEGWCRGSAGQAAPGENEYT